MKIYTKTGDTGATDLIGARVDKDDLRIECYGTLDEANSFIGLLISNLETAFDVKRDLYRIQKVLFDVNTELASIDPKTNLYEEEISYLEERIDYYMGNTPELHGFILPGGSKAASTAHVVRTVLRRGERRLVSLQKATEINPLVVKYINRLSDYFFSLARYLNKKQNIEDILK